MNQDYAALAENNRQKALRAIDLVAASLSEYRPYDPGIAYTPKALEPYDALADRFVRAVECALRYFRSHELVEFAEQSDTTRSLLNRMEKIGLVRDAELWLVMRNTRNRIVHDYLPEQIAQMFETISGEHGNELLRLHTSLGRNTDAVQNFTSNRT
jgi:hypothetical protein